MSETEIRDDRENGRLEALQDGEVVGRVEYFVLDAPRRALVPVHTVVEPAHEGQGIAGTLARTLYETAGAEGVPVVPLCPYVARWAERHPDQAPAAPAGLVAPARAEVAAHPERW